MMFGAVNHVYKSMLSLKCNTPWDDGHLPNLNAILKELGLEEAMSFCDVKHLTLHAACKILEKEHKEPQELNGLEKVRYWRLVYYFSMCVVSEGK